MKTLLYLILGILLGLACVGCVISALKALVALSIFSGIINGLVAFLFGYIAKVCFAKL